MVLAFASVVFAVALGGLPPRALMLAVVVAAGVAGVIAVKILAVASSSLGVSVRATRIPSSGRGAARTP